MSRFDPEKMAVYRLAREHTRAVRAFLEAADTKGYAGLVKQLRDSTASVPANILEAKGDRRIGKQHHYFSIAKGSLLESWAHCDTIVDFGLIGEDSPENHLIRDRQNQIVALLITTIRSLEKEAEAEEQED